MQILQETSSALRSPEKFRIPFLDSEGLFRWAEKGLPLSKTETGPTGKDVLRSAFFGRSDFWKELFGYARLQEWRLLSEMGWILPTDRASFAYRLKKAGYPRGTAKNLCLWLGAIDEETAKKSDGNGYLNAHGLRCWCHEGYLDRFGKRTYGKNVLRSSAESWRFWESLKKYAASLSVDETGRMGWKFPYAPEMLSDRFPSESKTEYLGTGELFKMLGVEVPSPKDVPASTKGYLSDSALRKWAEEGIYDPLDGKATPWSDILLDALYSGAFWKYLEQYSKSSEESVCRMLGGKIPYTEEWYRNRVSQLQIPLSPKGVCKWFGILPPEIDRLSDHRGFLSAQGLREWYENGYQSDSSERVLGKNVLRWCYLTDSFWESLSTYALSITPSERRRMGGKFPRHAKSLSKRTSGKESSVQDILRWFGTDAGFLLAKNVERDAVPPFAAKKWGTWIPESLPPLLKGKIRNFAKDIFTLVGKRPDPLEYSKVFKIREFPSEIAISCPNAKMEERISEYRWHVENVLSLEISEVSEKPVSFKWRKHGY